MDTIRNIIRKVIAAVKAVVGLIRGKNEKYGKKLTLIAALLFVAVCAAESLLALAAAEREAAQRRT